MLSHFVEQRPLPWAEHTFDDLEPIKAHRRTTELVSYRPLPNGFEESGFRAGDSLGWLVERPLSPKADVHNTNEVPYQVPLGCRPDFGPRLC